MRKKDFLKNLNKELIAKSHDNSPVHFIEESAD
jgi:hypothetical protein